MLSILVSTDETVSTVFFIECSTWDTELTTLDLEGSGLLVTVSDSRS